MKRNRRTLAWFVGVVGAMSVAPAMTWTYAADQVESGSDELQRRLQELQEEISKRLGGGASAESPDVGTAEGVLRAIEADYLTPEERAAKRVFHGLWTSDDLNDPALRAQAALMIGAYNDPSLHDEHADPDDRAEALLAIGDLHGAIALTEGRDGARAVRIRAEALEALGRFADADASIEPLVARVTKAGSRSAPEITEAVRALLVRARIRGQAEDDYQAMLRLLVSAQQDVDRLYWPALVTQAQLLLEKDNRSEAAKVAEESLSLNPSNANAWAILGRMTVDGYNFPIADRIASRLDRLVRRLSPDDLSLTSDAGDLIRANAWLRQNDPDYALLFIERVLARYPMHREALAVKAAATALKFDFDATDKQLAAFDELSPGSATALLEVGSALASARQYEIAAKYLERARDRQPNWSVPHTELGLLEMQSGRDDMARLALREAVRLDPFNVRARNSLKLIEDLASFKRIESEHFIVRYQDGPDAVMAREMIAPLEEIHRVVSSAIEHSPKVRTTIDLMPDHEWFAVRITGMPQIHTIAAATGPVIAMEAPNEGPNSKGPYDWVRVIRHEYTHTVTLSRTGNRIPHWFTEAAAVYVENAPRDYDTWQLLLRAMETDTLFDLVKINVAFVRPEKPQDRAQAYAQGHWMYQFIVDAWGASAPLRLMDLYAKGVREAQAFQDVLGVTQDEFMKRFVEWAHVDAVKAGMIASPTINELRLQTTLEDEEGRERVHSAIADLAKVGGWAMASMTGLSPEWFVLPVASATPELVEFWSVTHPTNPDVLDLMVTDALAATNGRASDDMVPLLERYAQARPVDPRPHRLLAQLYLVSGRGAEAIPHLEYLDAREAYSPTYAAELAKRYAAIGEWDKAWSKAVRATQIAPFNATYRELAATVAIKRNDLTNAEHQIIALTELEPRIEKHKQRLEAIRAKMKEAGR